PINQPIVPPTTTSDAKCFCAAIRDALTMPAKVYAVIPTILLLCLYSWSNNEAIDHIWIACPEGNEVPPPQKSPGFFSSGRLRRVASFKTPATISESSNDSVPSTPISRAFALSFHTPNP